MKRMFLRLIRSSLRNIRFFFSLWNFSLYSYLETCTVKEKSSYYVTRNTDWLFVFRYYVHKITFAVDFTRYMYVRMYASTYINNLRVCVNDTLSINIIHFLSYIPFNEIISKLQRLYCCYSTYTIFWAIGIERSTSYKIICKG